MIDFEQLRRGMVDSQVRPNDVTEPRLIEAMLELPRERFVPEARRSLAYLDDDLEVREAAGAKPARYLLEPMVLAKLIQALEVTPESHVLDVGTATGYSAAVLGRIAGEVTALEEEDALSASARKTLAELRITNVTVVPGKLPAGWPVKAPYDVILLNGSVEIVPDAILSQLKEGGRLGAVVRTGVLSRAILHVKSAGVISRRPLFTAAAPALPGFDAPRGFVF
jgi:protein-L-isoaspartate(D-aspartate) O-methyltransferase